jgi:hypothetical protein
MRQIDKASNGKLLTSKRKRETDHIKDNEQCLPQPLCPPAERLAIETPGGKQKVVASSAPTDPAINIPAIITPAVSKTSRIRLNKKVRTPTDSVIAAITIIATTLKTTPSPPLLPPPLPLPKPPLTEQEYPGDGRKPLFWTPEEDAQLRQLAAGGQRKVHFPTDVTSYPNLVFREILSCRCLQQADMDESFGGVQ